MNVLECIRTRRSVRTFDETPLQPEDASAILVTLQHMIKDREARASSSSSSSSSGN